MLRHVLTAVSLFLLLVSATAAADVGQAREDALAHAADLAAKTEEISQQLWEYSEVALEEQRSAALLADYPLPGCGWSIRFHLLPSISP